MKMNKSWEQYNKFIDGERFLLKMEIRQCKYMIEIYKERLKQLRLKLKGTKRISLKQFKAKQKEVNSNAS